ncbi:MAG: hypothetical protein AB2A00_22500 [Myxococcota bacterium]
MKVVSSPAPQVRNTEPSTTEATTQAHATTSPTPAETSTPSSAEAPRSDGYEVSNPRLRLPVDRAGTTVPAGDTRLQGAVTTARSASQLAGARGGGNNGVGNGLNGTETSLRTSGSGRIPASSWDNPAQLLGRLTQTPRGGEAGNSQYRCGPSNLLGAALMNGPDATARFLERSADSADATRLPAASQQELRDIAGRVRNRTATYEDLSRAQGLLYQAGNTRSSLQLAVEQQLDSRRLNASERRELRGYYDDMMANRPVTDARATRVGELLTRASGQPTTVSLVRDEHHPDDPSREYYSVSVGGRTTATDRSGFDDHELRTLSSSGGGSPRAESLDISVAHPTEELVGRLRPGEAATIRVSGTPPRDGDPGTPDHFVTVGRRPDGTAYLYNPDPARGDHTLFTGGRGGEQPANFLRELRRYDERISFDGDGDQPNTTVSTLQ